MGVASGVGEIRTHEGLAPLAVFKTELPQTIQSYLRVHFKTVAVLI